MAKKRQKGTKGNKVEADYLVDKLNDNHQQAVYMRLAFADYVEIKNQLKVSYSTIRKWFAKGGECHEAYRQITKERSRENLKAAKKLIKKFQEYAPDMLDTLYRVGKRNWKSAESLLDRAGFSPVEKIEQKIDMKGDREMQEAAKEMRESAKQLRLISRRNQEKA